VLMYQENRHVTLLDKVSLGSIFVYRTSQSCSNNKFHNIYNTWLYDGTGGDCQGQLLTQVPFNDGQCYQSNRSPKSIRRQNLPQRPRFSFEGNNHWCTVDFNLLANLKPGQVYTLYWV
ncbi:hypothetical protein B0J11DRAFT_448767, partial [Dendryphion nanum]